MVLEVFHSLSCHIHGVWLMVLEVFRALRCHINDVWLMVLEVFHSLSCHMNGVTNGDAGSPCFLALTLMVWLKVLQVFHALTVLALISCQWCVSHSGELGTQKLKSHLMRIQSLKAFPLKPGVGQYIAMHATLSARDCFLTYFYPSGPFSCIFSKTSPNFSCVGCG